MSGILVPIDFSDSSAHSLQYACHIARSKGMELTFLHCYSSDVYNRRFDFQEVDYEKGVKGKLVDFYKKHKVGALTKIRVLAAKGTLVEKVISISPKFDLIVISGHDFSRTSNKFLGSRSLMIVSGVHCPVVIVPVAGPFREWNKVWHIKRKENESLILKPFLEQLKLNPDSVQIKSMLQISFTSKFWQSIVGFVKTKKENIRQSILNEISSEELDLLVLVSHRKSSFQRFVNDDPLHVVFQFGIPILICQAK